MTNAVLTQNLWFNRGFLILLSSTVLVGLGGKIFNLALPLIVYELTQSSTWMGWMRAVEYLPNLLLALFIGVWVDHFDRKQWAMVMLGMQSVLFLVICWLVFQSGDYLWALFPIAFLLNACNYGYGNAKMGIQKNVLMPEHQGLAIARLSGVSTLLETAGPFLSGLLLLVSGFFWPMAGSGILFFLALLVFSRLPWQHQPSPSKLSVFESLKGGWVALKQNRPLWLISLAVIVVNTTSGIFDIQIIFAARDYLKLNPAQIGFLASCAGGFAFLGTWLTPYIRQQLGLGRTLIGALALEALAFVIPVWQGDYAGYMVALSLAGFFGVMANICIWSYRQESTPSQVFGRVAGITGSIFKLGLPFGLAMSGYIVNYAGIDKLFFFCAIIQWIVVVWLIFTVVRTLR